MCCSTSRVVAEYGSQGQVPIHPDAALGSWLDKIPRPEGAQYSVARFAGSVTHMDVIPGLRSLRSLTRGYPIPPLRGSLTRTSVLTLRLLIDLRDVTTQLENNDVG